MRYMFFCILTQVKMLVQGENGKLRASLVANLKSAVTASFLMLPESFSEEDLFLQIAGLSYAGTSLFTTAETRRKCLENKILISAQTVNNNQLVLNYVM